MYIYHYVKKTLKPFDKDGKYQAGTSCFTSLVRTTAITSPYYGNHLRRSFSRTVPHTGGDSLGENKVTTHETVRNASKCIRVVRSSSGTHKASSRCPSGILRITHVLLPKHYLDVIDEGSMKIIGANGGRHKMLKF